MPYLISSILFLSSAVFMSSCIILVLHASSCACCLVPALAGSASLASQSVPVLRDVLNVRHSERHHLYWLDLGSFCLHVLWFCFDSQLELRAGRRSSHANYCVCIPSLVPGWSSKRPRSLVSRPVTMISFFLVGTPMNNPCCHPHV